jgi:hypothetical protein
MINDVCSEYLDSVFFSELLSLSGHLNIESQNGCILYLMAFTSQ